MHLKLSKPYVPHGCHLGSGRSKFLGSQLRGTMGATQQQQQRPLLAIAIFRFWPKSAAIVFVCMNEILNNPNSPLKFAIFNYLT